MTINKGDIQVGSGTSSQFGILSAGIDNTYIKYDSTQVNGTNATVGTQSVSAFFSISKLTLGTTATNWSLSGISNATLANVQAPVPVNGIFTNWQVYVGPGNNSASSNVTLTLMKNGVATAMTIVIAAGVAGLFGVTGAPNVAFSAGDLVSISNTSSGTGSVGKVTWSIQFGI